MAALLAKRSEVVLNGVRGETGTPFPTRALPSGSRTHDLSSLEAFKPQFVSRLYGQAAADSQEREP